MRPRTELARYRWSAAATFAGALTLGLYLRLATAPTFTLDALLVLTAAGLVALVASRRAATVLELERTNELLAERVAERTTELTESEEQFRSSFMQSPVGMAMADLRPDGLGRILLVNHAYCALTGYAEHELVGMRVEDFTHPDDRETDAEWLMALATGQVHDYEREKRYTKADGEVIWVSVRATGVVHNGHIEHVVAHVEDITERRQADAELTRRALCDPLTGLPNRLLLMDRLAQAHEGLHRHAGAVAVMFLDLDHFKSANDSLGHDAGDEILRTTGERISATLRGIDTVSRLGGDEFVVVCPEVSDGDAAWHIAERIVRATRAPITVGGRTIEVSVSLGIALTRDAGTEPEQLLRRADSAMYRAKQHGRGRIEVYSDDLHLEEAERLEVHHDLRLALEHDWFRLYYQPIVELATGRIRGVEALLRMEHPERGLLLPSHFIGAAEESDLIVPIGDWVLREACSQLARWDVGGSLRMSVNVSARQVVSLQLASTVQDAAARAGIDPSSLCIEMTERALIDADDDVVTALGELSDTGAKVAIDDFGTGYSSLTYLRRFPVDVIKIDRSFVDGLPVDLQNRAIVEAVTALGATLRVGVVAEGIETPEQAATLREIGCELGQGYLYSRPLPADELADLLRRHELDDVHR